MSCEQILKFTPGGSRAIFASGISNPSDLAFDYAGNLYVAEAGAVSLGLVLKITPDGHVEIFSRPGGVPFGLAFDDRRNLFVGEFSSGSIYRIPPDGDRLFVFTDDVNGPNGLAFDANANLFVSDSVNGAVWKFTPAAVKSAFASNVGRPMAIAFEPIREKLRNVSARGLVGGGENVLIGGFILGGNALANSGVVVRAIGPSLSQYGIENTLSDPQLELYNASGTTIASNDNWQDTQATQINATGLAPRDAHESAIFATLPAGNFTAVVRGAVGSTGVALIEVYSLNE